MAIQESMSPPSTPRGKTTTTGLITPRKRWLVALTIAGACLYLLTSKMRSLPITPDYDWAQARVDAGWDELHQIFVHTLENAKENEGLQLLFYGDSITECLRGTEVGQPHCQDVAAVYNQHFRAKFRTDAFAIAGDQTPHLLWRLRNGESPAGSKAKAAVLLIGTNDLGYAHRLGEDLEEAAKVATRRVISIVQYMVQQEPGMHVVLLGILPRGYRDKDTGEFSYKQPGLYTPHIQVINEGLRAFAETLELVTYVYCGDELLVQEGDLNPALIPDALHPNGAGMTAIFKCLDNAVLPLLHGYGPDD